MIRTSWFEILTAVIVGRILWDIVKAWWTFHRETQDELWRIRDAQRRQDEDRADTPDFGHTSG